jgi:hypothetical protein
VFSLPRSDIFWLDAAFPSSCRRRKLRARATPAKISAEPVLYVGARVIPAGSTLIYEITGVSSDGAQVDLCLRATNLERFRVPVTSLKFVGSSSEWCPKAPEYTLGASKHD